MKLAIITGASRGIGAATANTFIGAGYSVVNLSRSSCPVEGVVNIAVDIADETALQAVCNDLRSQIDAADETVIIHNAAVLDKDNAQSIAAARFTDVLQLNVVAPAIINANLLPVLKPKSAIVFVGSTLSTKAVANSLSYVTSKHALLGLMRATCQDLQGSGVHTAMVMPGFTNTEMLRDHVGNDEAILSSLAEGVLLGRLAEPQEIATVIFHAATHPVLNGAEIDANLGQIQH